MKGLLDGWGMRTDRRDFEHAGGGGGGRWKWVAVKQEGGRVEDGGTRGGLVSAA